MAGNAKAIAKVWTVIDTALGKSSPKAAAALRKPATDKALATLEKTLETPLSEELRAYLTIHDGQEDKTRLPIVFVKTAWILLPATAIGRAHKELCGLDADGEFDDNEASNQDGLVQAKWWSKKWVPFAVNAGGDYLCVDMGPTKKGKAGQILWWYHDEDFRDREYEDLTSFFQVFADDLSAGKLTVRPDGGIVGDI